MGSNDRLLEEEYSLAADRRGPELPVIPGFRLSPEGQKRAILGFLRMCEVSYKKKH